MRKFLSVIGLGILCATLILVGVVCSIGLGGLDSLNPNEILKGVNATNALFIAGIIGGFGGGIASGIMALASLFTAKTYDK